MNSFKNHTNEKYKDVWSKDSDNLWIKSFKQQQQSTNLKPSVEQHHKHNQAIRINNKREEQTHQALLTKFGSIWPNLGERAALQSTIKNLTKWLQNELQERGTKAHNEQNLNLPIFSQSHQMKDTQWFSLSKVFWCFP